MSLTQQRLKEVLDYDPETGVFVWKIQRNAQSAVGKIAGKLKTRVALGIKIDRHDYLSHRLAWLYVHGKWPDGVIDHINGDPKDNRICNLRDVPQAVNIQNRKAPIYRSKSGILGVTLEGKKFRAKLKVNGEIKLNRLFDDSGMAANAYLEAKRKYHVGCTI